MPDATASATKRNDTSPVELSSAMSKSPHPLATGALRHEKLGRFCAAVRVVTPFLPGKRSPVISCTYFFDDSRLLEFWSSPSAGTMVTPGSPDTLLSGDENESDVVLRLIR